MSNRFRKLICFSSVIFIFLIITAPLYAQDAFIPAKVRDISDRKYEPALIKLLDEAKESIVMSMFSIGEGTKYNNPVKMLVNDLVEAKKRGVNVTIYLNTRFAGTRQDEVRASKDPIIKTLKDAGCIVYLVPYHQRLHDKLIIVDNRYVVEASTNWSISGLRDNYESATLIDSEELAKIKLVRIQSFSLEEKKRNKKPDKNLYIENLPKEIGLPKALLLEKRYLPTLARRHAGYSIDLYLILYAYSQKIGKEEFFIDMGSIALSMGMLEGWSNTTLRNQIRKNLRDLKRNYDLVDVKFFMNKDAWVELKKIPGETFTIPVSTIVDNSKSYRIKIYLMAENLLAEQGEDINTMSIRTVAKKLHLTSAFIHNTRQEMKGNLRKPLFFLQL